MLKYGRQYLQKITDDQFPQESLSTTSLRNASAVESAKSTPNDNNMANLTPRQAYRYYQQSIFYTEETVLSLNNIIELGFEIQIY